MWYTFQWATTKMIFSYVHKYYAEHLTARKVEAMRIFVVFRKYYKLKRNILWKQQHFIATGKEAQTRRWPGASSEQLVARARGQATGPGRDTRRGACAPLAGPAQWGWGSRFLYTREWATRQPPPPPGAQYEKAGVADLPLACPASPRPEPSGACPCPLPPCTAPAPPWPPH